MTAVITYSICQNAAKRDIAKGNLACKTFPFYHVWQQFQTWNMKNISNTLKDYILYIQLHSKITHTYQGKISLESKKGIEASHLSGPSPHYSWHPAAAWQWQIQYPRQHSQLGWAWCSRRWQRGHLGTGLWSGPRGSCLGEQTERFTSMNIYHKIII